MKPVLLRMEAFGPYATVAEVDFEPLADVGLFVVSGPTGSGKSTIFDAICFAIYGSLSGARQGHVDVRSHYADPSAECLVRFVFDADGHRWRVTRQPSQVRQKRRGSGTTERPADALLERWTAAGWEPDAAKVRDVTTRCRELVGLSLEQFERVVLLPQGKFAEVLNARTSERADLLRTLFGSEVFDRAAEVLAEQAREGERALAGAAEQRAVFHRRATDALDRADAEIQDLPTDVARVLASSLADHAEAPLGVDGSDRPERAHAELVIETRTQLSLLDEAPMVDVVDTDDEPSAPELEDPAVRLADIRLGTLPVLEATASGFRSTATSARSHLERAEAQGKAIEQRASAATELAMLDGRTKAMEQLSIRIDAAKSVVGIGPAVALRDRITATVQQCRRDMEQLWADVRSSSERALSDRPSIPSAPTADAISSLLEATAARTSAVDALVAKETRVELQRTEVVALTNTRDAIDAAAAEAAGHLAALTLERNQLASETAELTALAARAAAMAIQLEAAEAKVAARRTADEVAAAIAEFDTQRVERAAEAAAARQAIAVATSELALLDEQLTNRPQRQAALESAARRRDKRAEIDRIGARLATATAAAAERQRQADVAFAAFVAGTAPRLAADLADGEPCPVCGALEHPAPAGDAAEPSLVDVAAVERASAAASAALTTKSDHQAAFAGLIADDPTLADTDPVDLDAALAEATEALAALDQLAATRTRIAAGIEALEERLTLIVSVIATIEADCGQAKETLSGCLGELGSAAQRTRADLIDEAAALRSELATAVRAAERLGQITSRAADLVREVNEIERSKSDLAVQRATATERIEQIGEAIRRAEVQRDKATDGTDLTMIVSLLVELRRALLRTQQLSTETATGDASLEAASNAVVAIIGSGGFSSEREALEASMEPTALEAAEVAHAEWRHRRTTVAATVEALDAQGLPDDLPDIDELRAAAIGAETRHRVAVDALAAVTQNVVQAAADIEEIASIDRATSEQRSHHEIVRRVASVVKGNNSRRLSLENWVLSVYLRDVVDHANLHLHTMSNGRYRLLVQDAPTNQVGQHGLDLVVDDAHTGRVRPSVSLSGGETFQASLALALGLADVVMIGRAGLHLDALFVDEGFGSLDADAVDQAITVLDGLRSRGSMVGVITHVEALKNALPVAIEVHPRSDHRGSEIRQVA